MQLTQTVFAIAASLPEVIQAGETLLLNFRVTLNDPDIGDLENAAIAFVIRQGAEKLLEINSNAMPWAIQADERSPTVFAGTLTVDTLPLVPYINTGAIDTGWYVADGQSLSFSPIRKTRVKQAIAIPDTAPQLAITQILGLITQTPLIEYLPSEAYELELSQQLELVDQQPVLEWTEEFDLEIGQLLGSVSQQPAIAISQFLAAQQQLGGIVQAPEIGNGAAIAITQQLQSVQQSPAIRQNIAIALDQQLGSVSQAPSIAFTEAIAITSPPDRQAYQRNGSNQASIPIVGTATPNRVVEARWGNGAWTAIATSNASGNYSGTLTAQPVGQNTLEVRLAANTSVTASRALITITDVYLIIGQSNIDGRFTTAAEFSHATLQALEFREAGSWANLQSVSTDFPTSYNVWGLVATQIAADQSIAPAFLFMADGGTSLVASPAQWAKGGTSYEEARTRYAAAATGGLKAALWLQGETDASAGTTQTAYANALSLMLDNLQTDLGIPALKLVVGQIGSNTTPSGGNAATEAQVNAIRLAQSDRWLNDPDVLVGVTTYDLALRDGLHFADSVQTELANRWWRSLRGHFYGGESPRSLQFSSASASGNQITLTLTGGVGAGVTGLSTTGWRVTDGAGTRSVTNASASGKVITLTTDQALAAPVAVSFGFGNTAIGATLRDQGTIPLPPEAFISRSVSGGGAAPSFLVQDTMSGTSGNTLRSRNADVGGAYTKHPAAAATSEIILTPSGRARANDVSNAVCLYTIGTSPAEPHYVEFDVFVASNVPQNFAVVSRCNSTSPDSSYGIYYQSGAGQTQVVFFRRLNGNATFYGVLNVAIAVGSTAKLRLEISDAVKRGLYEGTEIGRTTENAIAAGGAFGLRVNTPTGTTNGDDAGIQVDNLVAGLLGAAIPDLPAGQVTLLDNFNDAGANITARSPEIGLNWQKNSLFAANITTTPSPGGHCNVAGNAGTTGFHVANATPTDPFYVEGVFLIATTASASASILARASVTADTCYLLGYNPSTGQISFGRRVTGTNTNFFTQTVTKNAGANIKLRMEFLANGDKRAFVDDVLVHTTQDNTITAAGFWGLRFLLGVTIATGQGPCCDYIRAGLLV